MFTGILATKIKQGAGDEQRSENDNNFGIYFDHPATCSRSPGTGEASG
jgi:hypothetical protein